MDSYGLKPYCMNRVLVFIVVCAGMLFCSTASKAQSVENQLNGEADHTLDRVDSVSYLLGVNFGMMLNTNNFFESLDEMNVDILLKGMADAMKVGQPAVTDPYSSDRDDVWAQKFLVSPYDMNQILNEYLSDRAAYKAEVNRVMGEEFLAANAMRPEVQVTESGLQYVIHKVGEGENVNSDDRVVVSYRGTLIDGTEFDSNDSIEFAVKHVVPGWSEGLTFMNKGAKATLYIPSNLAYGTNPPRGSVIEPNSLLIFEVEVVDIIRN